MVPQNTFHHARRVRRTFPNRNKNDLFGLREIYLFAAIRKNVAVYAHRFLHHAGRIHRLKPRFRNRKQRPPRIRHRQLVKILYLQDGSIISFVIIPLCIALSGGLP